jgi:hypothetical protein
MKACARNLKVREQELLFNGAGVRLTDLRTKQYSVTVCGVDDDGRKRLDLTFESDELEKIVKAYEKCKRFNNGDFTDPWRGAS